MTRRKFLLGAFLASPALVFADAKWLEPEWVRVRHLPFPSDRPSFRLAHITDLHHKGDRAYLEKIVRLVNAHSPDAVCFTGDFIEQRHFLSEALELVSGIKSPVYGVPGNHDYWSGANFQKIADALARAGGRWLLDEQVMLARDKICLTGSTCLRGRPQGPPPRPNVRNILALHYPLLADRLGPRRYDLLLAGHSHGGQVRVPFFGAVIVPYWVGRYEMGLYQTPAGPLYVNPGLGWLAAPVRFCCRPEITLIDL